MKQEQELKKTPLVEKHRLLKAKLIAFGEWLMPIQYEGVLKEHQAVREACGLFDVSHMGEIFIEGDDAFSFLQKITINDVHKLELGQGQYTAFCLPSGGLIDDLILYRLEEKLFLACVNASNTDKDFAWMEKQATGFHQLSLTNKSKEWAQLALQGPKSEEALSSLLLEEDKEKLQNQKYMQIQNYQLLAHPVFVARTGYTGEKGYELYLSPEASQEVWDMLFEKNQGLGLKPIGLGARDTLRLEASYPLYGNDLSETINPLEAGLAWAVKLQAKDFIGKKKLLEEKKEGLKRKLCCFKMQEAGIARAGMSLYKDEKKIGLVTSGSYLPSLSEAGGLCLLDKGYWQEETCLTVDIRGKKKNCIVTKRPLYTARTKT